MTREEAKAYIIRHCNPDHPKGKTEWERAVNMAIKALEQPEPKWIPVSERLPKIGKEVLLSEPNDMFIAEYHGSGLPEGLWRVDGIDHYLQDIKECAWMPLPDPYRKEGEANDS